MTAEFEYVGLPYRIVFGRGLLARVNAEVARLRRSRVLLLTGGGLAELGDRVENLLGPLCAARFDGAALHTPVSVTEEALRHLRASDADCVVAVGGGSTTGLSKALAARTGVDQIILPTTYAGSEVTPVLGETAGGKKTTRSTPSVLPETVIYDVELSRGLPVPIAVTSAVNALAHAIEALYSAQANPIVDGWALDAISGIGKGLRHVIGEPTNVEVRSDLLRGAWLAGMCLASVGMGLHHKLCHVLGGSFGLPHAITHTVILPHVMRYNSSATSEVMWRIGGALDVPDAPAGVFDLIKQADGPTSLRELGFDFGSLSEVADQVIASPYPNPKPLTREGILGLLTQAWYGVRPARGTRGH
ncbi:maleylacetate reductase [Amycolatopsis sp. FDAARGOS 1241]|uniref:maleylacetate reductase n=1 Tax=Amycolatopsis sp. FDAARGOS 1241 TaxID=2778070 RepID=UPI001950E811|nr:maleylacetate reductase [Amycolatopsis sp. FDAARGOS 1241]QRP48857.1 maleylacetate reductase [Amycolatopsis sp. FDAARGOS 1241]